ncbi:hypothetical protein BDV38DRAFT_268009 [Aspergillus pseudotamarii]|uniref:Saccharopine dehydrogenase-domain-containing protein n=1 Tax=Aspergillus pseudotamarii TaxID=132259 RepID=A0A5N6T7Y0_ASPPS|nr:uncharacterized protein BDV38DRAFT_268009 [Aspergillus pseudotamarii]KAE8142291.1 hypothetical protein BDV38DRAFT_268009 [Aspergillus pseudotamarii]
MQISSTGSKPVIFIGATDAICGEAIRTFVQASDVPVILEDSDEDALRGVVTKVPGKNITIRNIAGVGLVIQGAQPYYRTSTLVLTACIDAKVPYLDYSNDLHSTQVPLDLHERAKREGLDTIEGLDICWFVSEEGGHSGREVLEHLMHITGGPSYAPTITGSNDLFHEIVHPEPITLPRRLPNITRIRTISALSPAPFNGFARGLGVAVHSGAVSIDAAIDFLDGIQKKPSASWSETIASHGIVSLMPLNLALWGMINQVRKGECTSGEVLSFLVDSARGKQALRRSGILVRGIDIRDGHPTFMGESMATSIGASCAAFALMVLDLGARKRPGVQCPEDWAELEIFIKSMEKLGCPWDQILESVERNVFHV